MTLYLGIRIDKIKGAVKISSLIFIRVYDL